MASTEKTCAYEKCDKKFYGGKSAMYCCPKCGTYQRRLDKGGKMKKAEREHIARVVSMGCIVCVNLELGETPAEYHHIGNGTMGKRSSNYEGIALCHPHHRTGGYGVAVHSGRVQWESNFGTEQELLKQTLGWLSL